MGDVQCIGPGQRAASDQDHLACPPQANPLVQAPEIPVRTFGARSFIADLVRRARVQPIPFLRLKLVEEEIERVLSVLDGVELQAEREEDAAVAAELAVSSSVQSGQLPELRLSARDDDAVDDRSRGICRLILTRSPGRRVSVEEDERKVRHRRIQAGDRSG